MRLRVDQGLHQGQLRHMIRMRLLPIPLGPLWMSLRHLTPLPGSLRHRHRQRHGLCRPRGVAAARERPAACPLGRPEAGLQLLKDLAQSLLLLWGPALDPNLRQGMRLGLHCGAGRDRGEWHGRVGHHGRHRVRREAAGRGARTGSFRALVEDVDGSELARGNNRPFVGGAYAGGAITAPRRIHPRMVEGGGTAELLPTWDAIDVGCGTQDVVSSFGSLNIAWGGRALAGLYFLCEESSSSVRNH